MSGKANDIIFKQQMKNNFQPTTFRLSRAVNSSQVFILLKKLIDTMFRMLLVIVSGKETEDKLIMFLFSWMGGVVRSVRFAETSIRSNKQTLG